MDTPDFADASSWPGGTLDIQSLQRIGWRPVSFNQFILKIHSRCNLACDYCYVYETADQTWREQPAVMDTRTFEESCRHIREHLRDLDTPPVSVVFHGGEPLLVGHRRFEQFGRHARETLDPVARLSLGMQTNGTLLDERFLKICDDCAVHIGVSLDGSRTGHDRHRRYRRGAGSFDRVQRGLATLASGRWRHLFSGLLCTVDLLNDPVETYEELARFGPPGIDFLLPHGNWTSPPPGKDPAGDGAAYGDWLIAAFDRWYGAPVLETRVRIFEDIIELLLGGQGSSESVGLTPIRVAVIETDGTVEQVDELKSAYVGAARLPPLSGPNPLDAAMWDSSIVARQIGVHALSGTCRSCPIHTVCGGGNYVHRYRQGTGFRNPSVYCADLMKLIRHIEARLRADIAQALGK